MIKKFAVVRFQFEALHNWPEPKNDEKYLAHPHRHIFHCELQVEQFHNERDVEYIELKRAYSKAFSNADGLLDLGSKSCESIAEDLLKDLVEKTDNARDIKVSVFEDGENGAHIQFTRPI